MNNKGLTIIELLVGLTISVMIFMFSANIMANLFFTDTKSKQTQDIEQVKSRIESELSDAIRWSQKIELTSDSLILDDQPITLDSGRLTRGGEVITPSNVVIESIKFTDNNISGSLAGIEVEVVLKHAHNESVRDAMKIVVSQRRLQISEGTSGI